MSEEITASQNAWRAFARRQAAIMADYGAALDRYASAELDTAELAVSALGVVRRQALAAYEDAMRLVRAPLDRARTSAAPGRADS